MASGQFKQRVRSRGQQRESVVTRRLAASDHFWSARPVTLARERVDLSDRYNRTNEIQSETHSVHRGGRGGATGRMARPVTPSVAVSWANGSFLLGAPINTCWPAPRGLSWTFWHSNILLSWAYSLPLIYLAWLTNQSEFEWSQVHLIVSLHLVGTWVSIGCGILVTFGGCCHLTAWRQRKSCGKSGACSWPPPGDLWGVLCLPRRSAKGNSSKLLVSLSYLTCVGSCGALESLALDFQLATEPRSGGRHNGDVACR
jgi:hypothetical protein